MLNTSRRRCSPPMHEEIRHSSSKAEVVSDSSLKKGVEMRGILCSRYDTSANTFIRMGRVSEYALAAMGYGMVDF